MKQSNPLRREASNETIRLVFFGSSKFVIPILEVLKKNFNLALVVTTEQQPTDAVPTFCQKNLIPYITIEQLNNETTARIKTANAHLAVLAYFGLILPTEILNLFPQGIINTHPSLLPKYRGPTPGQTAILNGDTKTGVTLIKLDQEVDHGPILTQKEELIRPSDTAEILYERLFKISAGLIVQTIELYLLGKINLTEQDHSKATYTKHLTRQDGYFDIDNPPPSDKLDRMIKAYYPWPGVWTTVPLKYLISSHDRGNKLNDETRRLKLLKTHLEGKRLILDKVQVEGKKPMKYKDFINGYPALKSKILPIL